MPNKATRDIKDFSRATLENAEYRERLKARIAAGEAQSIEMLLYHYGYGKPRETVAIKGGNQPLPLVVKLTGDE